MPCRPESNVPVPPRRPGLSSQSDARRRSPRASIPAATTAPVTRDCAVWTARARVPSGIGLCTDCRFGCELDASDLQEACRSGWALAISDIWRDTGQVTIEPAGLDPAATERIGEFLRTRGLRRMA